MVPLTPESAVQGEVELPLNAIAWTDRLRPTDLTVVAQMAVSMREVGQIQAILVRPAEVGFEGVDGAHRAAALEMLGHETVRCRIEALSDLDARQMEVDANLIRGELSAFDFMRFLAERLEVYAERNPEEVVSVESAQSGRGRGRPPKNFLELRKRPGSYVRAIMGFAEETARDVRLSRAKIYGAMQTYAGLAPDVRTQLAGSPLARNDAALRQLSSIGAGEEQRQVARVLLEGKASNVSDARAIAAGNTPVKGSQSTVDETLNRHRAIWTKATPSGREAILEDLMGRSLPGGFVITRGGDRD